MRRRSVILALSMMVASLSVPGVNAAEIPSVESVAVSETAADVSSETEEEKKETVEGPAPEDTGAASSEQEPEASSEEKTENSTEAVQTGSSESEGAEAAPEGTPENADTGASAQEADTSASSQEAGPVSTENAAAETTEESATAASTEDNASTDEPATSEVAVTAENTETSVSIESSAAVSQAVTTEAVTKEQPAKAAKVKARSVDMDAKGNILHFYLYGEMVKNDWAKISIKGKKYKYYFDKNGDPVKGIKKIGGKYYYFNKSGQMQTGWVKFSNGLWGYYTESGAAAKTGWRDRDKRNRYYLKANGRAGYGWLRYKNRYYFLSYKKGGKMITGPWKIGKKYYFLDQSGVRATTRGWKRYNNGYYFTYKDGSIAVNKTINGYKVGKNGKAAMSNMDLKAQNYSSNTEHLILVSKDEHRVGIYTRSGDLWTPIKKFACGDGKSSTPTIEGTFTVGLKMLYFDSGSARCWYATQFCGNYLFHSVLYYRDSGPYDVMDGRVGVGVSHGCVRLQVDNARWIYNNISRETKVVVYR